jgi:geranylgeranyl pyrophosphate synthase
MRFLIPELDEQRESGIGPGRFASIPGLCCHAVGGQLDSTLEISAAWLLIYTAAHVVDMVEDGDYDPQISKLGGPGVIINAANGMFISAVQQLQSLQNRGIPAELVGQITADFLDTLLIMTGGQHLDISLSSISLDQWWQIAEAKSGAFFSLACRSGSRLGTGVPEKIAALNNYGYHLGLMLQILDDLEDYNFLLDSKIVPDQLSLKKSLAAAYANEVLPDTKKEHFDRLVHSNPSDSGTIEDLVNILDECGAGMYMVVELKKHFDLGINALNSAEPASPSGEYLEGILNDLKLS